VKGKGDIRADIKIVKAMFAFEEKDEILHF
jgi:hypothetical protein